MRFLTRQGWRKQQETGSPGDSLDWKQKYAALLREVETRDKTQGAVEQILRMGLNRLSYAVDSGHAELSSQLNRLRRYLRDGADPETLKAVLDDIALTIRQIDAARPKVKARPLRAEDVLEEVLLRLELPVKLQKRAERLRTRLREAAAADPIRDLAPQDNHPYVESLASLVSEAITWSARHPEAARQRQSLGQQTDLGAWPRLLQWIMPWRPVAPELAEPLDAAPTSGSEDGLALARPILNELVTATVQDAGQQAVLLQAITASEDEMALHQAVSLVTSTLQTLLREHIPLTDDVSPQTRELLIRLIERIDVPIELKNRVQSIKAMLDEPEIGPRHIDTVLGEIIALVVEISDCVLRDRDEIEGFLQQMTSRLRDVDVTFQENVAIQQASFSDGRELGDTVNSQVQEIEDSMRQARDLNLLKTVLRRRLETIRRHMQEYRQAEDERVEQAEQQVERLKARLQEMQEESTQLRDRIKEEREMSQIDALTGIPNRAAYEQRLKIEVARWQRYGTPLVMGVWDLDFFKRINDTYGHQAGDKVLVATARLLRSSTRETDFVARYGGEEFVMLLPETSLDDAKGVADKVRELIKQSGFHFRGEPVKVSASCGLSLFSEGDTPETVFERADQALYRAKEAGRNRCECG